MTGTPPDPSKIMEIGMGFFASKALLSAVELGVFEVLRTAPLNGPDLRRKLGLHERAAADFLDALVALGFLDRAGNRPDALYANTSDTAAFLDPASPSYLGGILKMANNQLYHHWGNLSEGLRTGQPQSETKGQASNDLFAAIYADPARLAGFLDVMAGVQLGNFLALAERFDFSRVATVCDVGGALSIAIARRHPDVSCISYDLPSVTPLARKKIEAASLSHRIEARSGSFLTDDLPRADVITMGNVLHDWGTETKESLIAKGYAALPEGGAFIAIENIIDDARRENAFGLLMSLNMLIETPDGYDYSFAQFNAWCTKAGFRSTEKFPLRGPASAAVACK